MTVVCYPSAGKAKGKMICEAFAEGCGGRVVHGAKGLESGAAFFYGTTEDNRALWFEAMRDGRDWFYCDNAYYFGRGNYFRVTKNAMQHTGIGKTDGRRFRRFNLRFQPWKKNGRHIVVATQSNLWHKRFHLTDRSGFAHLVERQLREYTDRPVIHCLKPEPLPDPYTAHSPKLEALLADAWAVVVHTSSAAVAALLAGVPVFTLDRCMATAMGSLDLSEIESPRYPDNREEWAGVLADNQWTVDEIRNGSAWLALRERAPVDNMMERLA